MRRLYCGDCLEILRSDAIDTASVDLVYLDPPFNSKSIYNLPFQTLGKDVAAVEAFTDIWHWDDETRELEQQLKKQRDTLGLSTFIQDVKILRGGEDGLSAYLVNMAIRLHVLKRVMKSTASLYLHCDPAADHYLKILLDAIFDPKNFHNEIIWKRTSGHSDAVGYGSVHDMILFYSKTDAPTWNDTYQAYDQAYVDQYYRYKDKDGRRFMSGDAGAAGLQGGGYEYEWKGIARIWRVPIDTMKRLDKEGRIFYTKNGFPRIKRYLDEAKGMPAQDVWNDIEALRSWHQERLGYPTQKPVALLERILSASSNEGEIVLDPFCGCGTTLHAAEKLRRNWIGIDISRFSVGVVKNRLRESFEKDITKQITISGIPTDVESAWALAHENPWEFEKWACGQLGAKGLYKRLGAKGADAGIDGVIEFYADAHNPSYAIVQVKGGHVGVNDVKALYTDVVTEPKAAAGVFVCFDKYKRTALGATPGKTFKDNIAGNSWPIIQVLTVEEMLDGSLPRLPNQVIQQGYRSHRERQPKLL
jgi:DNA modification methylase